MNGPSRSRIWEGGGKEGLAGCFLFYVFPLVLFWCEVKWNEVRWDTRKAERGRSLLVGTQLGRSNQVVSRKVEQEKKQKKNFWWGEGSRVVTTILSFWLSRVLRAFSSQAWFFNDSASLRFWRISQRSETKGRERAFWGPSILMVSFLGLPAIDEARLRSGTPLWEFD